MNLNTLHGLDLYQDIIFDTAMRLDVSCLRNVALGFGDLMYNNYAQLNSRIMQVARYIKANCPHLEQINIVVGGLGYIAAPHSVVRLIGFGDHLEDVVYTQLPYFLGLWFPGIGIRFGPPTMNERIAAYKQNYKDEMAKEPASAGWANIDFKFSILAHQTSMTNPLPDQKLFIAPKHPLPCNDVTFYTKRPAHRDASFQLKLLGNSIRCYENGELMYRYDGIKDLFDEGEGDHRGAAFNPLGTEAWWTRRWMGKKGWEGPISSVHDPSAPKHPNLIPKTLTYGCLGPKRAPGQRKLQIISHPRDLENHLDMEDWVELDGLDDSLDF